MAYFNVIQISATKPSKDQYICKSSLYEDNLYLSESDWGEDALTREQIEDALKKIQVQLKPFATVNRKKETITFKSPDIVKKNYMKQVETAIKTFQKKMQEGAYISAELNLRHDISELSSGDLFYTGCCQKLASIITDYLSGYLPKTIYIGAILKAHC